MYSYGSEAHELEYSAALEAQRKQEEAERVRREKKDAENQRKYARRARSIKVLAIFAAILAIILIREAEISKLCGEVTNLETQLENDEAVVTEMELRLSGSLNLNEVEDAATTRLGMKKPDSSQYVYIDMGDSDAGSVIDSEQKDESFVSAAVKSIKKLLEYLY